MEVPTILAIAQSIYNVVASLLVNDDPVYEVAMMHLVRWVDPFDSLADIKDSVY
jgi:hypothetical protein